MAKKFKGGFFEWLKIKVYSEALVALVAVV